MSVTLVLGGARSGKSRYAESLAKGERHYIATAQAFDDEMRVRIAAHRGRREGWTTHEEPLDLCRALRGADGSGRFILVDCLTLWLTNLILADMKWSDETDRLIAQLSSMAADVALVSNEVGMGLVPENTLGRRFRDAHGILNQRVAAAADAVIFVAAGLPLILKGPAQK